MAIKVFAILYYHNPIPRELKVERENQCNLYNIIDNDIINIYLNVYIHNCA